MLRNRAKRKFKYGTVAQEIQFSGFYRTAIKSNLRQKSSEDFKTFAGPNVVCDQNLVTLRLRNKTIHNDI